MKYKGIVFDFDGTIIDSEEGIAKAFQAALKSKGILEELDLIKGLIGPPLSRTIITKYGLSEEEGTKAMEVHRNYYRDYGIYESRLFPNVEKMLKTFNDMGIILMIATNKPESYSLEQMKYYDIEKYFNSIVGNNESQTRGTKADFIKMAINSTNIDVSEVIMVGDRYIDIEAGKQVGLKTVGVTYGYGSEEEIKNSDPTYIIENIMELIDIIKEG